MALGTRESATTAMTTHATDPAGPTIRRFGGCAAWSKAMGRHGRTALIALVLASGLAPDTAPTPGIDRTHGAADALTIAPAGFQATGSSSAETAAPNGVPRASGTTGAAWHLDRLNVPQAWADTQGEGVIIAIIDSGVDAGHPDLKGRVLPGFNLLDHSDDTQDHRGHGTAVAGAAAAGFNALRGSAGVAASARILPLKVTDERGYTSIAAVTRAIYRAADQGARVVNVSFEFVGAHPEVQRAARYLQARGGVLVVPSGNRGERQTAAGSPAIITVAATDEHDRHPDWSSQGPQVSVSAPGQGLWVPIHGQRHAQVSGTSYASPLVAGVLALMVAAHPQATPLELRQALQDSAVDLGEPGPDPLFGHGRVDARAAVDAVAALVGKRNVQAH